jgi:hypothetical protein
LVANLQLIQTPNVQSGRPAPDQVANLMKACPKKNDGGMCHKIIYDYDCGCALRVKKSSMNTYLDA